MTPIWIYLAGTVAALVYVLSAWVSARLEARPSRDRTDPAIVVAGCSLVLAAVGVVAVCVCYVGWAWWPQQTSWPTKVKQLGAAILGCTMAILACSRIVRSYLSWGAGPTLREQAKIESRVRRTIDRIRRDRE